MDEDMMKATGDHLNSQREQVEKALDGDVPDGQGFRHGAVGECKRLILSNYDDAAIAALEEKCRADTYKYLFEKYVKRLREVDPIAPTDNELFREYENIMIEKEKDEISDYHGLTNKMREA